MKTRIQHNEGRRRETLKNLPQTRFFHYYFFPLHFSFCYRKWKGKYFPQIFLFTINLTHFEFINRTKTLPVLLPNPRSFSKHTCLFIYLSFGWRGFFISFYYCGRDVLLFPFGSTIWFLSFYLKVCCFLKLVFFFLSFRFVTNPLFPVR